MILPFVGMIMVYSQGAVPNEISTTNPIGTDQQVQKQTVKQEGDPQATWQVIAIDK